jgi:hypothetical protein
MLALAIKNQNHDGISAFWLKIHQFRWDPCTRKNERYFEARGNLQLARTIFFGQLIAQLIVWKHTNSDIILLGDFN